MSKKVAEYYPDLLLLGGLLLLAILPFMNILLSNDQLIYSSDIDYFFPHETINRELLSDSAFPLWNPYFGAGSPQLGKIQVGLLYPPSMLLRGLPIVQMFNWDAVLHLFFAGAGIFLLSRHWKMRPSAAFISSVIFMFSGAMLPRIMIGHVSVVHTIAWIGWLLFAYDRLLNNNRWRDLLLTVWFTLLIILGGHPQMSVLVLLIPVTYFLFVKLPIDLRGKAWRKVGLSFFDSLLVALFSIGLVSIQLFPFLEWLSQTNRGQGNAINSLPYMTNYSLNLEFLVTPIMPLLWFSTIKQNTIFLSGYTHFWEASPFITVTGLFLLALGATGISQNTKNRHLIGYLIGLAIAGLIMSVGKQNPLYEIFHSYYPYFRAPGRFLIWWAFALALLAGFALDRLPESWTTNIQQLKKGKQIAFLLLIFCLILWIGFTLWGSTLLVSLETHGIFTENFSAIALESVPRSLLFLAATSMGLFLLFYLGQTRRIDRPQWEVALIILILAESLVFTKLLIRPYPVSNLYEIDHPLAQLSIDPGEIRIGGYRVPPNYHTPTLTHVRNGEEYFALERLMHEGGARAINLLSARFWPRRDPLENAEFTLLQKTDHAFLYEHKENFPRLYAVTSILPVKSDEEALAIVVNEEFNPSQQATITLQEGQILPNLPEKAEETALFSGKYVDYKNNSLTAEVMTDRPILLIFSEIDYPGWEATVNGESVPIYRSNYTFRGIALETPGTYQIKMNFRPEMFYKGLAITGITAVVILLISFILLILKWLNKKKIQRKNPITILFSCSIFPNIFS